MTEEQIKSGGRSEPKACALGTGQFWPSTEEGVDARARGRGVLRLVKAQKNYISQIKKGN